MTITRGDGAPTVTTFTFDGDPAAGYVLDVTDNGSRGLTGAVRLNGTPVIDQNAMSGGSEYRLHQTVAVQTKNTLEIRLEGKPGASMTLMLRSGVQTIGTEGGVLRAPGGDLLVEVPAGALSAPVELSIEPISLAHGPELGPAWELGPTGTVFNTPVKFMAHIDPARLVSSGDEVLPLIVTAPDASSSEWTIVPNLGYDATTSTITAPLDHFSLYALSSPALNRSHIGCARYLYNHPWTTSLLCTTDSYDVPAGSTLQLGLLANISYVNLNGLSILGVIPACENIIIVIWSAVCLKDLITSSSNPGAAFRNSAGTVIALAPGATTLSASYRSPPAKGSATIRVTGARTVLLSLASDVNAELGGVTGALVGGASLSGGRLVLDGSTGYAQLSGRIIPASGSFSVALFARETVTTPDYVEFMSQGLSGTGFYIGHTPTGYMRISDAFQNTSVLMPQDHLEHHYAVTYDAGSNISRGYLDGRLVASAPGSPTRGTGGDDTRLGRQFSPFAEFLRGTIDDVAVYPTALSATDVEAIARRSPDLPCSAEGSTRSTSATTPSAILFENQAPEPVRIEWLDYVGARVLYNVLSSGSRLLLNPSYLTHPWIITGTNTGRCYGIWFTVSSGRMIRIE